MCDQCPSVYFNQLFSLDKSTSVKSVEIDFPFCPILYQCGNTAQRNRGGPVKCPECDQELCQASQSSKRILYCDQKAEAAHQIQDSGEFQEFNDDMEYILDGLHLRNNLPMRYLSKVTLAT